ncbi:DUF7555 family protein [Halapricum desulfuricans]
MSIRSSPAVQVTSEIYRSIEFAFWVGTVSVMIVGVSAVGAVLFGSGLLTLKYILFVVGFVLFGIGSFGIQPKSPRKRKKRITVDSDDPLAFEERIQQLPPLDDNPVPHPDRISRNVKVFVTSLVVLGVSLILEYALGVSV